jgi:hypothetical protein
MIITKSIKILIICVSIIVIISVLWLWLRVPFITQSVDNVYRIVVVYNPYSLSNKKTIYITEQSEIEYMYSLLNETTGIRTNRRPEGCGMQHDPRFILRLEYHNGEIDIFSPTEANNFIFRFLDTRGSHGARGFITGINEKLLEYVDNLINH